MPDFDFTIHAKNMLVERQIPEEWVWRVLLQPDEVYSGDDDNLHYIKAIQERDERVLRIIVNPKVKTARIITLFFDRRLTRSK